METKTIVITGASDGIGAEAARQLKAVGHNVVVVGRNPIKTERVATELGAPFFTADFANLSDVVRLADELDKNFLRIDVLCNNAGAAMDKRKLTADGFEQTFQVNVLSPFLLTYLLKSKLCASRATVVQTASIAANIFGRDFDVDDLQNENDFSPLRAYGRAKLCNVLFMRELNRRFGEYGLCAVAFQPGVPRTNFASESTKFLNFAYHSPLKYLFTTSKARSAKRLVHFVLGTPNIDFECGEMYTFKNKYKIRFRDPNGEIASKLWRQCEELLAKYINRSPERFR